MMGVWPNWMQSLQWVCFTRRQALCPHAAQAAGKNQPMNFSAETQSTSKEWLGDDLLLSFTLLRVKELKGAEHPPLHPQHIPFSFVVSRTCFKALSWQAVSCRCTSELTPCVCSGLLWVWFPLLLGFDTSPVFLACWEVGVGQTHHIKYWLVPDCAFSLILHYLYFSDSLFTFWQLARWIRLHESSLRQILISGQHHANSTEEYLTGIELDMGVTSQWAICDPWRCSSP